MHLVKIQASEVFQALADPIRVRMMRLFVMSGEEACLCELADSLLEPEYKLSRHLKIIRDVGLLSSYREGKWVYHELVKDVLFLRQVYASVKAISDADGLMAKDLERFQKRMRLREGGRCRTGPRVESRPRSESRGA